MQQKEICKMNTPIADFVKGYVKEEEVELLREWRKSPSTWKK